MVFLLLLVLALVLFAFTVLPIWRHESWWVRGLDFPRLQFFVLAAIALILNLTLLDLSSPPAWGLVAIVLFCLCYQAWWIIPYTRFHPVEVKSDNRTGCDSLRILTANILMQNRNADALIELVHENEPDILVALESDTWWQTRLDVLESDYPYTIKCPLGNRYGMHVYSKLALTDSRIDYLIESDVPSIHTLASMSSGQRIRMHILHPAPPSPTENEESSERDAELITVAKSVSKSDEPVIVTGDLNDVAWSETTRLFRKISGLLAPGWGAACITPIMRITGLSAGRWTICFIAIISLPVACADYAVLVRTIFRF